VSLKKDLHFVFLNPQGNFGPALENYLGSHPDFGGQLIYVTEIARALTENGEYPSLQVDIVTRQILDPQWPGFAKEVEFLNPRLRIIRLPFGGKSFLRKEELWPYLLTEYIPRLQEFYRQEGRRPDFVTAHYADAGLSAVYLKEQTGLPFTFTMHSPGALKMDKLVTKENFTSQLEKYFFEIRIAAERMAIASADRIITSTHQEQEYQYGHPLYRDLRPPAAKFAVVSTGVDEKFFSPQAHFDRAGQNWWQELIQSQCPASRRHLSFILLLSRPTPKKNLLGFLRAFAQSRELQEHFQLFISSGDKDALHRLPLNQVPDQYLRQVVAFIKEQNLERKIIWSKKIPRCFLPPLYTTIRERGGFLVSPALYEPFGLLVLEALSCGLPVVSGRNGGPEETLPGRAILVDPEDEKSIIEGCCRYWKDRDLYEKHSRQGPAYIRSRFTWRQGAEAYLKNAREILTNKDKRKKISIPRLFFHLSAGKNEPQLVTWLRQHYFN